MKIEKLLFAFVLLGIVTACEPVEDEADQIEPPTFILNDAFDVTINSAFLTASITGDDIQEAGFIYGTALPLSEGSLRRTTGMTDGEIEYTLTGLSDNTEYFYAAYVETGEDEFYKSESKSFVTVEEIVLELGDVYEGGIIYYLDASGEHGLLASPENVTTGTNWTTALDACYAYELDGNSEWRLPDLDELEFLYTKKDVVGGFADIAYWSSSVEGSNTSLAYGVFFGGGQYAGQTFVYDKTGTYQYSRAIRDF